MSSFFTAATLVLVAWVVLACTAILLNLVSFSYLPAWVAVLTAFLYSPTGFITWIALPTLVCAAAQTRRIQVALAQMA